MRELYDHKVNPANDRLKISVMDEPGAGGANHFYQVSGFDIETGPVGGLVDVMFQNGPIPDHGVNGMTQEVLLTIVIDRLRSFQAGQFACRENALALTHIETGLLWLKQRTLARMARGVEGTHKA
jgi:hypothetical protein